MKIPQLAGTAVLAGLAAGVVAGCVEDRVHVVRRSTPSGVRTATGAWTSTGAPRRGSALARRGTTATARRRLRAAHSVEVVAARATANATATASASGTASDPATANPPDAGSAAASAATTAATASDSAAVRTTRVLVATVRDDAGRPVAGARIDWVLGRGPIAAGEIVDVEGGRKTDNTFAQGVTGSAPRRLDLGTDDPSDDLTIGPGQTWCTITSSFEGPTEVVAYARDVADWRRHTARATTNWVDAAWDLPPDAVNRCGAPHTFDVRVLRASDGEPLAGWEARFRVVRGPACSFDGRGAAATATTGADGIASVTMTQSESVPGTNEVEVVLVRPAAPGARRAATFGPWTVRKRWVEPAVALARTTPDTASAGGTLEYTLVASNPTDLTLNDAVVTETLPAGVDFVSATPAADVSDRTLAWRVGALDGGGAWAATVRVRPTRRGIHTFTGVVAADGGSVSDESSARTVATGADVRVALHGPAEATVLDRVRWRAAVRNDGDAAARDVVVAVALPPGLTTATGAQHVEAGPFDLGPGGEHALDFDAVATSGGAATVTASASWLDAATAAASAPIVVRAPRVVLAAAARRASVRIGRPAAFDVTVTNAGDAAASDVVVEQRVPPGLEFLDATDAGVLAGDRVVWRVASLAAGNVRTVTARFTSRAGGSFASSVAARAVTCDDASASASVAFAGTPALRIEVVDEEDPVDVGGRASYLVVVGNQGSADATDVAVVCTLSPRQRFVAADTSRARGATCTADGAEVRFSAVAALPGGEELVYRVVVDAAAAGDARFTVRVTSDALDGPVEETEPTRQD